MLKLCLTMEDLEAIWLSGKIILSVMSAKRLHWNQTHDESWIIPQHIKEENVVSFEFLLTLKWEPTDRLKWVGSLVSQLHMPGNFRCIGLNLLQDGRGLRVLWRNKGQWFGTEVGFWELAMSQPQQEACWFTRTKAVMTSSKDVCGGHDCHHPSQPPSKVSLFLQSQYLAHCIRDLSLWLVRKHLKYPELLVLVAWRNHQRK